ncbi:MAG: LysM peptidoglycan-binding domain-containing protein [Planctomycetota bacterium]|jgi:nucleoid-associated protein YgaU
MTREHKLALVFGFALVLVVGVLISDHFSGARLAQLEDVDPIATTSERLLAPNQPLPDERQKLAILAQEADENPQINPPAGTPSDTFASAQDAARSALDSIKDFTRDRVDDLPNLTPAARLTPTEDPSAARPVDAVAITVQAGDSLWKLTERATGDGNLYSKVAAFNASRLSDSDVVRPGMTLLVPPVELLNSTGAEQLAILGRDARVSDTLASSEPRATTRAASAPTYTVKQGDVLSVICQRELGTIRRLDDVLALNRDVLDSADSLRVGMVLRLPEVR